MTFRPTAEQQRAKELYWTGEGLRIEALAGTGKTTTLRYLVETGSPRGGAILYTAFNKKVIDDAKAKFGRSCKVSTNHALAWGVGGIYDRAGRLKARVTPSDLIANMAWGDNRFTPFVDLRDGAYDVLQTIGRFCGSADQEITGHHALSFAMAKCQGNLTMARAYAARIAVSAREAWAKMADPESRAPIFHDVYLKLWALAGPRLAATTILLDEAQDASGVMVGVLKQQTHAQLVIVGDRHQAIYGWRGAVDAMEAFDLPHTTELTQSFRFGPRIAEIANQVLEHQCKSQLKLTGSGPQNGRVAKLASPKAVLGRTNATILAKLVEQTVKNPKDVIGVVGGVEDLIKLVEAAAILMQGGQTNHPDLAEFATWGAVLEAVKHEAYSHLGRLVEIVTAYGTQQLIQILGLCRGNEKRQDLCTTLYSTAHKAKGSEFDSVLLLDDFTLIGPPGNPGASGWTPGEANLLYVAVTRAREVIDISGCHAVTLAPGFKLPEAPAPEKGDSLFDVERATSPNASAAPDRAPYRGSLEPMPVTNGEWSRLFTLPVNGLTLNVAAAAGVITATLTDSRTRLTLASTAAAIRRCQVLDGPEVATLVVGEAAFAIESNDARSIEVQLKAETIGCYE